MGKPQNPPSSAKPNPAVITLRQRPDESLEATYARCAVGPETQAAMTVREFTTIAGAELTMDALIAELEKHGKAGNGGDLAQGERMLVGQAHALDAIFGECARRARRNMNEYPQAADLYLRLGLRAQAQCRATWETLATIKNPASVAFVKQANIAAGPQQVNNGMPAQARAGGSQIAPNKLLEVENGQRLDTRAPGAAGAANPDLEAVGEGYGAEDGTRQSAGRAQRI